MPKEQLYLDGKYMSAKRIILGLLTLLAVGRVLLSLGGSLSEPQIQSRLQLYQTNLVLYTSELRLDTENEELNEVVVKSLGENPLEAANKQYEKARAEAVEVRNTFQKAIAPVAQGENNKTKEIASPRQQLKQQVEDITRFIDEIDLKRGILAAEQGDTEKAQSIWQELVARVNDEEDEYALTATVLQGLWNDEAVVDNAETVIQDNLDSWFRDRSLLKLYTARNDQTQLAAIQEKQQEAASSAAVKLTFISAIPFLGGFLGFILLLFLVGQAIIRKDNSILATNSNVGWKTPWDWEITWQVIIVGFFFVGQFVLPLLLGLIGFNVAEASLRIKALYVLLTYVLMAAGGIIVLFLSLKPYLPLPKEWFELKLWDNWFVWGFGGYLVAIPCVLLVSLLNQQIWQGQGGSNPLLYLALQAQDKVALAVFFSTASIAAPLFEELIFRGFLLPSLTRYFSVTVSIVLSGLLFAVAHLSLAEVLPLATLGIILGIVYTRSRNLLAPMLLHSLWNSGTLLSLFVLGSGV